MRCKTAGDGRGSTVRVGDRVTAISIHNGDEMGTGTVVEIWKGGKGHVRRAGRAA